MPVEQQKPAGKLVRDLVMVLGLGVVCAILVALVSLYFLSPTGSYKVKNILIDPSILSEISYSDINPDSGTPATYTFDKVEFLHYNRQTGEWLRSDISKEAYQEFYAIIAADRSMPAAPEQVVSQFEGASPSTLTLVLKREGGDDAGRTRAFQEVQILNFDDYYRIQIHDQNELQNWAYFYHENIYKQATQKLLNGDG